MQGIGWRRAYHRADPDNGRQVRAVNNNDVQKQIAGRSANARPQGDVQAVVVLHPPMVSTDVHLHAILLVALVVLALVDNQRAASTRENQGGRLGGGRREGVSSCRCAHREIDSSKLSEGVLVGDTHVVHEGQTLPVIVRVPATHVLHQAHCLSDHVHGRSHPSLAAHRLNLNICLKLNTGAHYQHTVTGTMQHQVPPTFSSRCKGTTTKVRSNRVDTAGSRSPLPRNRLSKVRVMVPAASGLVSKRVLVSRLDTAHTLCRQWW